MDDSIQGSFQEKTAAAGIVGYGNLGRGVKNVIGKHPDLELKAVFSRRLPEELDLGASSGKNLEVRQVDSIPKYRDKIDVLLLCGGSASDLPDQGPRYAQKFNTVDSYDNHDEINDYYQIINDIALENDNTCAVGIGWDPGLFSLNRMMMEAVLPQGSGYTFWGPGLSQGHSDAIRELEGVADAVQYTIPDEEHIEKVREGKKPPRSASQRHIRRCFVVAEENADRKKIEQEIKNMPNYFADYQTEINFISREELNAEHSEMPHGGFVLRNARTGSKQKNKQIMEFSLDLDSNPEFTASVMVACARAITRLNREGKTGAYTIYDLPPAYLSPRSPEELRKNLL